MDLCGCRYFEGSWRYFVQVSLNAHATILSSVSRTVLTQTFVNPSPSIAREVVYTFPLYDGVSVVGYTCRVGDRVLHGKVKSRKQANEEYEAAVAKGEKASVLNQSLDSGDVHTVRLGNVEPGEQVVVDITFIGELKHDTQADGTRYTIPNAIAPRYGLPTEDQDAQRVPGAREAQNQGISITVDVLMEKPSVIRQIQSPSHPITVSLGRMSSTRDAAGFEPSQASASLRLLKGSALLERDFVLVVNADGQDTPHALLEEHPALPGQRAFLTTLVPKFNLPAIRPELVFVIDRSGSMSDKVATLQSALRVFLKSLPIGVSFNICSFGTSHQFLWEKSMPYDKASLDQAMAFVDTVDADMGGTRIHAPLEASVQHRLPDKPLEVLLLTDGQVSNQEALFSFVRDSAASNTARFFSLGIGNAASHSLIEGIARAGNGFSQSVVLYEDLSKKVVRMLKGALSPHIADYQLDIEWEGNPEPFEVVGSDSSEHLATPGSTPDKELQDPISLFNPSYQETDVHEPPPPVDLPSLQVPDILQAPAQIPPLYPQTRTTVCGLITPRLADQTPQALIFRATSAHGPLHLRIPIQHVGKGETIHQLAARKAMVELEEGHGWLDGSKDVHGHVFNDYHSHTKNEVSIRECQDLGTKYQVTGKHCSFVALQSGSSVAPGSTVDAVPVAPVSARRGIVSSSHFDVPTGVFFARGAPISSQPSSSLFGAMSSAAGFGSQGSGSLFGSSRAAASSQGGGSLFGSSRAAASSQESGSLFGSSGAASSSQGSGSLFGSSGAASSSQESGSLFGACSTQPTSSPFGASEPATATSITKAKKKRTMFGAPPPPAASAPAPPPAPATPLDELTKLQSFEGYWDWTEPLLAILSLDSTTVKTKLDALLQSHGPQPQQLTHASEIDCNRVIATMLAMGYLERRAGDQRLVWELMYEKADEWMRDILAQMGQDGVVLGGCRDGIIGLIG